MTTQAYAVALSRSPAQHEAIASLSGRSNLAIRVDVSAFVEPPQQSSTVFSHHSLTPNVLPLAPATPIAPITHTNPPSVSETRRSDSLDDSPSPRIRLSMLRAHQSRALALSHIRTSIDEKFQSGDVSTQTNVVVMESALKQSIPSSFSPGTLIVTNNNRQMNVRSHVTRLESSVPMTSESAPAVMLQPQSPNVSSTQIAVAPARNHNQPWHSQSDTLGSSSSSSTPCVSPSSITSKALLASVVMVRNMKSASSTAPKVSRLFSKASPASTLPLPREKSPGRRRSPEQFRVDSGLARWSSESVAEVDDANSLFLPHPSRLRSAASSPSSARTPPTSAGRRRVRTPTFSRSLVNRRGDTSVMVHQLEPSLSISSLMSPPTSTPPLSFLDQHV